MICEGDSMINFSIDENPKALKRHRMTWRGGVARSYDPSAQDKKEFLMMAKKYAPKTPILGAISVRIEFYMPRPKNHYRTGKYSHLLKADAPMNHTGRPDIDNLLKFVMDALNGVFYKDDSQICQVFTLKQYNTRPGTLVEIVEL